MNEYLFRGKTKETNEWVYGGIFIQDDRYFIIKSIAYECGAKSWGAFEVDPETVCCFIVPFDKDINNIYDIVEKQIKKKPVLIDGRMRCPECESNCNSLHHYCDNCGQAINWDEE